MNQLIASILNFFYSFTNNYGLAMVLFGIGLRLVLLPLDLKGRGSTRKMAQLQPQVNAINKKYANDVQMRQRKLNELYKKENYSQWGGCLPMLLQIPLLFIVFGALRNYLLITFSQPLLTAMEMGNHAGIADIFANARFLWIQNIFGADAMYGAFQKAFPAADAIGRLTAGLPSVFVDMSHAVDTVHPAAIGAQIGQHASSFSAGYDAVRAAYLATLPEGSAMVNLTNGLYILPLLAGGTQFLQSWLSQKNQPQNPDAPAAGSMKLIAYGMPLFSVYICATYTSLFTLYWITGSTFAVILQLVLDFLQKRKEAKALA